MKNIYVTKSFLPPMSKYQKYLDSIWDSCHLTNQGMLLNELEEKVKKYLKVKDMHIVSNGTIAIQLALNALDIVEGEIITTPFSYVATTSAILWERCTPVFVDINSDNFCIDAEKIEKAITKNTKAILAVHVFGIPCDIEKIESIAKRYNLKVIYDGAHAFGVNYKGKSLLSYGDISTCSFHATKLFHTIEGGCIIAKEKKISEKIELTRRFGHHDDKYICLGINAKASEFQAAMGLCNLKYVEKIIKSRKEIAETYDYLLSDVVNKMMIPCEVEYNYSYYPIVLKDEVETLHLMKKLNDKNIYPRRYFYPSLNTLTYLKNQQHCPVSEDISLRILCLPLYYGLEMKNIEIICATINECLLNLDIA
ncbi:MAG TPA: aminotransferase DegT [Candidatus Moranbacteria bacterium]|nr:aminotransferase DegT [Candidatus Moranbacteria bacterium]HBT45298.1 aminotransferase DegT [Candidatus Moranbacteria bacterium]